MSLTLKQMIVDLVDHGMTQAEIELDSDIAQSSISKILAEKQFSVFHEKADALRKLHSRVMNQQKTPSVA